MTDNKHLPAYLPAYPNEKLGFRGLTKREIIAAMCLQGLLASWGQHDLTHCEDMAHEAALAADALLTHLKNTEQ